MAVVVVIVVVVAQWVIGTVSYHSNANTKLSMTPSVPKKEVEEETSSSLEWESCFLGLHTKIGKQNEKKQLTQMSSQIVLYYVHSMVYQWIHPSHAWTCP